MVTCGTFHGLVMYFLIYALIILLFHLAILWMISTFYYSSKYTDNIINNEVYKMSEWLCTSYRVHRKE